LRRIVAKASGAVAGIAASVPRMGRRQRHSEFIERSREELERMMKDKSRSRAERLKVVAELKFLRARNRQKRSK
jgi:hypothetical protein